MWGSRSGLPQLVRDVDRKVINTVMQGLLPLEILKAETRGQCTDTTVVEAKCHFSCVQMIMIHTQLDITQSMQITGTVILELQLSANKME